MQADTRPLTHRRVLGIALPIVISNATVPLLGVVDTGVVGQIGEAAPIGAVGIGAIIVTALYWIFGFLRMGTAGLASQAYGAGDQDETEALLTRALLIGGAAGSFLILFQWPIFHAAFWVAPASDEVESLAQGYIQIRIWSAPAAIAIFGITGWLVAQARTREVLYIQLWMNGINMVLDVLFVLGFGWGVNGVAFATFLAEWSALGLGLWISRAVFLGEAWRRVPLIFDRARLRHMAAVNGDLVIRSVLIETVFVSFLFYASRLGDIALAANQILIQFLHVTAFALDGFAFAAEALVGQALGARARHRLRRGAWMTSLWGGVICISIGVFFLVFGAWIIDVMTTAPEIRAEARIYLIYVGLAPMIGVAAWMFDGIYIGATQTRDMRNSMLFSTAVYFLCVWAMLPGLGNHGLWLAVLIFFGIRGITLGLRYPALEARADGR